MGCKFITALIPFRKPRGKAFVVKGREKEFTHVKFVTSSRQAVGAPQTSYFIVALEEPCPLGIILILEVKESPLKTTVPSVRTCTGNSDPLKRL